MPGDDAVDDGGGIRVFVGHFVRKNIKPDRGGYAAFVFVFTEQKI